MDEQRNTRIKRNALYGPLALTLLTVAAVIFMAKKFFPFFAGIAFS